MKKRGSTAELASTKGAVSEDVVLANDPAFWEMIRESRRQRATVSLEEASRRLKIPSVQARRPKPKAPRR